MKGLYVYIVLLLTTHTICAANGDAQIRNQQDGSAQLNIYNHSANYKKDSILVIYDRFDHSGAGVVLKVYHPRKDHTVTISDIPAGKYYVTIQWLGLHHDRMEKIVKIKKGKCEIIPVKLGESEEFSKGQVIIPAERLDWANLKVVTMK
jgi:hypothetical protein